MSTLIKNRYAAVAQEVHADIMLSQHVQSPVGMSSLQSACPVGISGFSRILSEVLPPCGIASVPRCFLVMLDWLDIQCVVDMATFYVWRFPAKTVQFYLT